MLKVNCLINDTSVTTDIKNAIKLLVGERLSENKNVKFPSIYNELRKAGLEVDAESAGNLYNDLYGKYNNNTLSTEEEISEYAGRDVVVQQEAIVDNIIHGPEAPTEKQIGKLPPEKQVATMIARMFQEATFGVTQNFESVMKKMENLVSKAAKSLLPPAERKPGKTLFENLNDFFATESVQFRTLSGSVNTLQTLHSAVKAEVRTYLDSVSDELDDDQLRALEEQWEVYTEKFMQSAYDLMLGKSDQNKLLNESLKQAKIDGVQIVDVNGNVKWSALMEDNNPTKIAESVKRLFEDGVKDAAGNVHKYSREEARRIGEYFQRLYEKKLAAVVSQKISNQRSKNISAKNIISDFIKDRGFINLVKDKNGDLLLTQANWNDAMKYMIGKVGDKTGLDEAVKQLRNFLSTAKGKNGKPFTDQQKDIIENEFRNVVAAKQIPGTGTPGAMDRLVALSNLNGGKAFDASTQRALNKVLGVADLDQQTIDSINELVKAAESIMKTNNVTSSTSPNPSINRGAYAFQALSQIERRIKEIVRENKIDKSTSQTIIKYMGDVMNAASTSLLLNPGNFGENIITGFASNLGETVTMVMTNRKLYKKSSGNFWTAAASHLSGGVANEVIAEQDITADIQSGERLRLRALLNEFRDKGFKGGVSVILKSPAYAISILNRTFMNTFDAGFNSSILRKKTVTSMYNALRGQGMTSDEVLKAMSDALKIPDAKNAEIEQLNNEIMDKLKSVGLHPTIFDKKQNLRDLMLSLYEDALGQAALNNGTSVTPRQIAEATKAMIDSSQLQAKVLTGKKPIPINDYDPINSAIYGFVQGLLTPQRKAFTKQQELEERGELKEAARSQFVAEAYKNTIARFAGGIANFMALAVTATPYGFVTANSLRVERNRFLRNNPEAANVFTGEPGDIRKYAEYHNLMRSMVVRAAVGTLVIGSFIAMKLTEDDDDDDRTFVENMMQTKSGRRLLQKYLPLGVNIAAAFMYDVNDKKMDTKMERLIDVLSNVTGQQYDKWSSLKTSIGRAKTDGDVWKAAASYIGGAVPTLNINQPEQITKFYHTIRSGFNRKDISTVKRDEGISKAIYERAQTGVDVIFANGGIDAFRRIFNKDKSKYDEYNRYDIKNKK